MKIVVFGPDRRVGALEGNKVIDLNRVDSSIPANLTAMIAAGKPAIEAAKKAIANASGDAVQDASKVKLHAPWPGKRIAMVGGNYADHLAGMEANMHGLPLTGDAIAKAFEVARGKGNFLFLKVL